MPLPDRLRGKVCGYMVKLSCSILAADFMELGSEISKATAGGADYVHIDVMDGIFVPNISLGVPIVKSVRKGCGAVLDVHLMIEKPGRYVKAFAEAGADIIVLHLESDVPGNIRRALEEIRALGARAGLTIKPGTPVESVEEYLPLCDLLLIMSVEPGFGGQKFMPESLAKLAQAREMIDRINPGCELEVDGGVDMGNMADCVAAGADVLVMGTAVFAPEKGAKWAAGEVKRMLRGEREKDVNVRAAAAEDMEAVCGLSKRWEAEGITYGYAASSAKDFEGNETLVAELGGSIVGYISGKESVSAGNAVIPEGAKVFEVEDLYVKPEARGGVGSELFKALERGLAGRGVEYILLGTATKDYRRIQRFYTGLGMEVWTTVLFKKLK